ncbi:MAG TPA: hypothetical protein PKD52_01120 [Clostridiales bacterium]|nr:hypothetical protein [Clostridiales bacterium]
MKLIEKVTAYKALGEIMKEDWDFAFIYPLMGLMRLLEGDYALFCNEEMKLVAAYGAKESNGKVALDADGVFSFADEESMNRYQQKHKELEALITDAPERISLPAPGKMKGAWLAAIAPFCSFQSFEEGVFSDE